MPCVLLYILCVLVVSDELLCLRWLFADGDKMENHFKPPYVALYQSPDPSKKQIFLQHEVKYTYKQPGRYLMENKLHGINEWSEHIPETSCSFSIAVTENAPTLSPFFFFNRRI